MNNHVQGYMVHLKIALYLYLLMVTVTLSSAQSKWVTLRGTEKATGAVYAFVDAGTCFTCSLSLRAIAKALQGSTVPIVVYMCGMTKTRAEDYAQRELKGVSEVVWDELGAYAVYYQVREFPHLFVASSSGEILFQGSPGKSSFSFEKFEEAVNTINRYEIRTTQFLLCDVDTCKEWRVAHLPESCRIGSPAGVSIEWAAGVERYVVFNHNSRMIVVMDPRGRTDREHPFPPKWKGFVSTTPILFDVDRGGDTVYVWDTDLRDARPVVARYSVTGSQLIDTIPLPADWQRISTRSSHQASTDSYLLSRRITDGIVPFIIDDGAVYFREGRGDQWRPIGRYDDMFGDTLLSSYAWCAATQADSVIMLMQNLTDKVQAFDRLGNELFSIRVTHPESFDHCVEYLDSAFARKESIGKSVNGRTMRSRLHNIYYDPVRDKLILAFVVLRKQIYGQILDRFNRDMVTYVVVMDIKSRRQESVFQVPMNTMIYGVRDSILFGATLQDDELRLFECTY